MSGCICRAMKNPLIVEMGAYGGYFVLNMVYGAYREVERVHQRI